MARKELIIFAPTNDSIIQCLEKLNYSGKTWQDGESVLDFIPPSECKGLGILHDNIYWFEYDIALHLDPITTNSITFRKDIWYHLNL